MDHDNDEVLDSVERLERAAFDPKNITKMPGFDKKIPEIEEYLRSENELNINQNTLNYASNSPTKTHIQVVRQQSSDSALNNNGDELSPSKIKPALL